MCVSITLEHAIRKLCEREGLLAEGDDWKSLGYLLGCLKDNETITEHQSNQLAVWKNIRNDVAHGNFDKIERRDVEAMIAGVKKFVADQL